VLDPADHAQIRRARLGSPVRQGLHRIHHRLAPDLTIRESSTRFDAAILGAADGSYLEGYWQSERYFAPIAPQLRKEIRLRDALLPTARALESRIRATRSISVHVRRGDYVSQPAASAYFHTCQPAYYKRAMDKMLEHEPHAEFFVFSDDMAWSREHIRPHRPLHFVDLNAPASVDLHLLSSCSHHIMANSSFSWWGAWLNDSPTKRVIAPVLWFKDPSIDTRDLLPSTWQRL
jgi:Glycosyl transferase family 11